MSNTGQGFQLVEVVSECRLQDADGRELMYWRRDGRCLEPGFYVVHWPAGATPGRYNEDALFEGPFSTRGSAEADLPRIMAGAQSAVPREPLEKTVPITEDHLTTGRRPT